MSQDPLVQWAASMPLTAREFEIVRDAVESARASRSMGIASALLGVIASVSERARESVEVVP